MTVYRGLRVSLPRAAGATENMDTLIIAIGPDNMLWVDEAPVTLGEAVALAKARADDTSQPVLISGDRAADLGVSIELLSALREVGVESVSFQVRTEP